MELARAESLARELMAQWGLTEWNFTWRNSKRMLGCCEVTRNRVTGEITRNIGLSRFYVKHNSVELVTDTILHEIAHALAGLHNGHNHIWKRYCNLVGARPNRTKKAGEVNMPHNWEVVCDKCGEVRRKYFSKPSPKKWAQYCHGPCGFDSTLVVQKVAEEA